MPRPHIVNGHRVGSLPNEKARSNGHFDDSSDLLAHRPRPQNQGKGKEVLRFNFNAQFNSQPDAQSNAHPEENHLFRRPSIPVGPRVVYPKRDRSNSPPSHRKRSRRPRTDQIREPFHDLPPRRRVPSPPRNGRNYSPPYKRFRSRSPPVSSLLNRIERNDTRNSSRYTGGYF